MKILKKVLAVIFMVSILVGLTACSSHAPGYGNTSKCTICNKTATHKTSNYGYCDKHWKDATGQ